MFKQKLKLKAHEDFNCFHNYYEVIYWDGNNLTVQITLNIAI